MWNLRIAGSPHSQPDGDSTNPDNCACAHGTRVRFILNQRGAQEDTESERPPGIEDVDESKRILWGVVSQAR